MRRPETVSALLTAVFAGTPAEKRLREGRIWLVWSKAVGSRIALHAEPASFRDGTLTLTVDSAPWMQQLTFLKKEIIAKVNSRLGEELVREIYMKIGVISTSPPPAPAKKRARTALPAEKQSWIAEQTGALTDPELRAAFESLLKKDLESR